MTPEDRLREAEKQLELAAGATDLPPWAEAAVRKNLWSVRLNRTTMEHQREVADDAGAVE
jgi:hypothetical protein